MVLKAFEMCWQCAETCGKASPALHTRLRVLEQSLAETRAVRLLRTSRDFCFACMDASFVRLQQLLGVMNGYGGEGPAREARPQLRCESVLREALARPAMSLSRRHRRVSSFSPDTDEGRANRAREQIDTTGWERVLCAPGTGFDWGSLVGRRVSFRYYRDGANSAPRQGTLQGFSAQAASAGNPAGTYVMIDHPKYTSDGVLKSRRYKYIGGAVIDLFVEPPPPHEAWLDFLEEDRVPAGAQQVATRVAAPECLVEPSGFATTGLAAPTSHDHLVGSERPRAQCLGPSEETWVKSAWNLANEYWKNPRDNNGPARGSERGGEPVLPRSGSRSSQDPVPGSRDKPLVVPVPAETMSSSWHSSLPLVQVHYNECIGAQLKSLLGAAQSSVRLTCYTFDDFFSRELTALLVRLNQKGRAGSVRILVDASQAQKPSSAGQKRMMIQMSAWGAQIKTATGRGTTRSELLHEKSWLIDEAVVVVGSANATYNSMELCREIMLTITDPEVVALQATHFDELWAASSDVESALTRLATPPVPSRPYGSGPGAPRGRSVIPGQSYSPPVPGLEGEATPVMRRTRSAESSAVGRATGSTDPEAQMRVLAVLRSEKSFGGVGNGVGSGGAQQCATAAENAFPVLDEVA